MERNVRHTGGPKKQGLYDPALEHDACGFGFVVDIAGRPSHRTVRDALTVLVNLEHRGATGSETNTGDGAGLTIQIPHRFLADVAEKSGVRLRGKGGYGVGMVFLPQDRTSRVECFRLFEQVVADEGLRFLGWRDVPTENASLGTSARAAQPLIRQVFIDRPERLVEDLAFERKLYVVRRLVEKAVSRSAIPSRGDFYIPSLSCRTIVYKGMLNASQLQVFYPDLADERVESAIAMVHSRFSTNTFPSWPRAHPYRYISHNGEINTLRGNVNWMHARQALFASNLFGDELTKALPVIDAEGSDSAILDNVLELLYLSGRSLAHCSDDDGAGALAAPRVYGSGKARLLRVPFLPDGALGRPGIHRLHGRHSRRRDARPQWPPARALLRDIRRPRDHGLRSGRARHPADKIVAKGRLQPGRMFLVDTAEQRIVSDEELKRRVATEHPYDRVGPGLAGQADRAAAPAAGHRARPRDRPAPPGSLRLHGRGRAHASSTRWPRPAPTRSGRWATTRHWPSSQSGPSCSSRTSSSSSPRSRTRRSTPSARRSSPPPRRPSVPRATSSSLSRAPPTSSNCLRPCCPTRNWRRSAASPDGDPHGLPKPITLPILFRVANGGAGLRKAIEQVRERASEAIEEGHNIIILSDRGHDADRGAHPRAARGFGRPPPPRPGRHAHPGRTRARIRRAAGGPSLRPAHRLRRKRGEPVPRLRDRPRPGASGDDRRRRPNWRRRSTARRSPRASSRSSPRWASAPSRATTAPRSSRPWGSARISSTSTSPPRPRASAASASTSWLAKSGCARIVPTRPSGRSITSSSAWAATSSTASTATGTSSTRSRSRSSSTPPAAATTPRSRSIRASSTTSPKASARSAA